MYMCCLTTEGRHHSSDLRKASLSAIESLLLFQSRCRVQFFTGTCWNETALICVDNIGL